MEVPNGWFNVGELINVVEVLLAMILAHLQRHVFTFWLEGQFKFSILYVLTHLNTMFNVGI